MICLKNKYSSFNYLIIGFLILVTSNYQAQINCTSTTPFFSVNLTGNPSGTWTSPQVTRDGSCCGGGSNQTNCIELSITLDPGAEGIIFNVASGANPGGALYYQINCTGTPIASGSSAICLNGVGPHLISYCKVGNNQNTYSITSVPKPVTNGNVITADGCRDTLRVTGLNTSTITWNSISPGSPGQYNNYLNSLAGNQPGSVGVVYDNDVSTVVVTPQIGAPSNIQYQVCGTPNGTCSSGTWCSTSTVSIYPALFANAGPDLTICQGNTIGVTLTGSAVNQSGSGPGGTAPYTFSWTGPQSVTHNNVNPATPGAIATDNFQVTQAGTYTLTIRDATGCPVATDQVVVSSFTSVPTANAGADITICKIPTPSVSINGSVTQTGTGIWSGGTGSYTDNTSDLSLSYIPSAAELASGSVTLTLTPTNTLGCPYISDQMVINLTQFTSTLNATPTNITCNGLTNGSINLDVIPGNPNYSVNSYSWNTSPIQLTEDISGLGIGTYTVTAIDINGCTATTTVTITEPTILTASNSSTNVSCNGGNNGAAVITATGGTAGYNVSWTGTTSGNPAGTEIAASGGTYNMTALVAGTYNITLTDANNCTATTTVTITEPTILTATNSSTNVSCNGGNNGAAVITATGGTAGYNVSWTGPTSGNPAGTEIAASGGTYNMTALVAGTYTVTVTDANGTTGGCAATTTVTITEPTILTASNSSTNVSCNGGNNGAAVITATGGTAGYNVSWTGTTSGDPAGTEIAASGGTYNMTALVAGTYTVTVTDANGTTGGCAATTTVTITEPTILTASNSSTNVSCNGGNNGAAVITATGGTAGYNVSWTGPTSGNPAGTEIAASGGTYNMTALVAGTYTVTVTDANGTTGGCAATTTVTITEPTILTATNSSTNVSCNGGNNGAAVITATGGTAGYNVSWTGTTSGNPAGTEIAASGGTYNMTALVAGTYTVTVTDANGTTGGCAATTTVTITEPTILTASNSSTNVSCNGGNNGAAVITATGGTAGYNVSWTGTTSGNPAGTEIAASGGTYNMTALVAGTYTVTVTDANGTTGGCAATTTVTITEPTILTASNSSTNVSCNGGNNGAAVITATGGTAGYNISWTGTTSGNPAGTEIAASGDTYNMTALVAGTYTVTVTDANGCAATTTVTITEPTILTATNTSTNVSCNGGNNGAAVITATGGTAGYNVSWTGTTSGNPPGTEIAASGGTYNMTALIAGTYNITLTDANNCTATTTVTITEPTILTASNSSTNVSCNGGNNGAAVITATGGTAGYNVSWIGTTSGNPAGTEIAASGGTYNMTALVAGTYNITLTDANNCTATTTVTITEPTILTASNSSTNVSCNGGNNGAAVITATGGTAGYNVSWIGTTSGNPAGTEIAASGGTYNMTALVAGTYTVTVTDANNCTATTTVTITEPTILTASNSSTNVSCNGGNNGAAVITATGGTAGYNVSWIGTTSGNPAGTEIAASGGTYNMTALVAGTYTVTVTDANNCTATTTVTITEPTILTASNSSTNVSCNGGNNGAAVITATGGTAGYNVSWTGPTSGNPAGTEIAASGGTYNMTALVAGTYTVTVTDANGTTGGCAATTTVTITEPTILTASNSSTNVSCNGGNNGAAVITATGGTAGYNVSWTGTTSGNPAGTEIAASGGTYNMTALIAGTYYITLTDANNCTATTTVTITEPTILTASNSSTNVSCNGGNNGAAVITATGGTAGYNVSWTGTTSGNPAGTEIATSGGTYNMTALVAGTYNITLTDANNCTATTTVTITEPTILTASNSSTNVPCNGGNNGAAVITATGGTAGYNVSWTGTTSGNPAGTEIAASGGTYNMTALVAGTYNITLTDANNCTATTTVTITEPTILTASNSSTNVPCNGGNNGAAVITATGGTAGYNVSWTGTTSGNPAGTEIAASGGTYNMTALVAGTYNITLTDANNCTATTTVTITEPTILTASNSSTNVSCNGGNNGAAVITATGGTAGYNVSWTGTTSGNPAGTEIAASGGTYNMNALVAGTYNITLTDANNCTATTTVTITEPTILTASNSSTNVSCNGGNNGAAVITATGGTAGYNVSWIGTTSGNPAGTEIAASGGTYNMTALVAGTYNITLTDANNCTATTTVTITEPTILDLIVTGFINETCNAANGEIQVNATGGASGYVYQIINPITTPTNTTGTFTGLTGTTGTGTIYTIQVTDANGCIAIITQAIIQPSNLNASNISTNVSCNGGNNGAAVITATGGTAGYNVSWTGTTSGNPAGTEIAASGGTYNMTALVAGTYNITLTDANNCTATTTVTITEPTILTASNSSTNVSCNGSNNGAAVITATGGTAGYNVSWTGTTSGNPAGTDIAASGGTYNMTALIAGTYNITLTDANNCTATTTVTITEPTILTASNSSTNVSCNGGNNGAAVITATGGTAGYNVSWTGTTSGNPAGTEIAASGGTYNMTALVAGTYTVTVTDVNGCAATTTVTITEPTILTASNSSTNVSCNGGNNGAAVITATGGTAGYNVSWTGTTSGNPAGTEIAASGGTYNMTALIAGTYNITLTDANNCTATTTVTITEPTILTASNSSTNVSCNGGNNGAAVITATGGTAGYNVSWTGPTSGNPAGTEIAASGGTYNMTALVAGTYTVTVTDANGTTGGCAATTTVTITEPTILTATNSSTNVSCNGGNNGAAVITATGGTAGYNVSWTGTTSGNPAGTEIAASGGTYNMTALVAGTYTVTVTDANGTTGGCAATTTVTITEPTILTASNSSTNVSCNGGNNGAAVITATGGTAGYNVSWTGTTSGNPAGTEIAASGGTYNMTALVAGTYTVTVTDANGTTGGCAATTTVTITEPTILTASNSSTNVSCNGGNNGAAVITATGGTAGYNVSWTGTTSGNPAGTEIAASGGTYNMTALVAGTYTVTVTDANGTTGGCAATTTVTITEPTPLFISFETEDVICNGGTDGYIHLNVFGGSPSYTYNWNGPNNFISSNDTITNLISGIYSFSVHDNNGISGGCAFDSTFTINEPPPFIANITPQGPTAFCYDDSVVLIASPGESYLWNTGDTSQVILVNSSGNFSVTIFNSEGCSDISSIISVTVHPAPPLFGGPDQGVCIGQAVTLQGQGTSNYQWNGNIQNGVPFIPTETSTYYLTGTSNEGCTATDSVLIIVYPLPNVTAGNDLIICENETVILTASGGNLYNWSGNVLNGVPFTPPIGNTYYYVTGTSIFGCSNIDSLLVTVNSLPEIDFFPTENTGCAPKTIEIINSTQNSSNCIWSSSNGQIINGCNDVFFTFNQAGCYDITLLVEGSNGCEASMTAYNSICLENYPDASFNVSSNNVSFFDSQVDFTNTSLNATYYEWDFGDYSAVVDEENPSHDYGENVGNYIVTLIAYSSLGCPDTAYTNINVYEDLIYYVPNTFTPNGDDFNNTFLPIFSYGFDPYNYTLYIFDRWGELVFESHDHTIGWDGSYGSHNEIDAVQDGTYTWKIEFKLKNSTQKKIALGHVNVLK